MPNFSELRVRIPPMLTFINAKERCLNENLEPVAKR